MEQQEVRKLLQTRLLDLQGVAATAKEGTQAVKSADPLDNAIAFSHINNSAGILNKTKDAIDAIYASLDRLNTGDYGICLRCEEEIPQKRLQAVPWAIYCLSCQEKHERRKTH